MKKTHDSEEPKPKFSNPKSIQTWRNTDGELTLGLPSERIVFEYDNKGHKVSEIHYGLVFDMGDKIEAEYTWKYNDKGKIIEEHTKTRYTDNEEKYDDFGKPIEDHNQEFEKIYAATIERTFDDQKRLISEVWVADDTSIRFPYAVQRVDYSYNEFEGYYTIYAESKDARGRVVAMSNRAFSLENDLEFMNETETIQYTKKIFFEFKETSSFVRKNFYFDYKGNLVVEMHWNKDNKLKGYCVYSYDEKIRIKSYSVLNSIGKVKENIEYIYE